jgi:hypothetical protein
MKMIFWSFWLLLDHQNIPLGQHLATSPKACAVIRLTGRGAADRRIHRHH